MLTLKETKLFLRRLFLDPWCVSLPEFESRQVRSMDPPIKSAGENGVIVEMRQHHLSRSVLRYRCAHRDLNFRAAFEGNHIGAACVRLAGAVADECDDVRHEAPPDE